MRFDCLRRGECDAVPLGQPQDLQARRAGLPPCSGCRPRRCRRFVPPSRRCGAPGPRRTRTRWCASCAALAAAFRFIRDPANRDEVIKTMVATTGASEAIARQTLALYLRAGPRRAAEAGRDRSQRACAGDRHSWARPARSKPPLPPPERFVDLQYLRGGRRGSEAAISPPPWPRPTAHPSRRASSPAASCRARPAPARSTPKRRSNFWLVARSVASGSASRWRARLTTANSRSPTSAAAPAALAGRDLGFDLVGFLADLGEHRQRIVPVEADLAGLGLQLQRAGEGRERRPARRRARPCVLGRSPPRLRSLGLLLGLDAVPQALRPRRASGRARRRTRADAGG